jgi:hypothetical protein
MKTPDSFWTDPSADELVQRHRIHSSLYNPGAASPNTQRPHIGTIKLNQEENPAVAPVMAREHIESLHQNSYATLLYGKNNVNVQPVSWDMDNFLCISVVCWLCHGVVNRVCMILKSPWNFLDFQKRNSMPEKVLESGNFRKVLENVFFVLFLFLLRKKTQKQLILDNWEYTFQHTIYYKREW